MVIGAVCGHLSGAPERTHRNARSGTRSGTQFSERAFCAEHLGFLAPRVFKKRVPERTLSGTRFLEQTAFRNARSGRRVPERSSEIMILGTAEVMLWTLTPKFGRAGTHS